MIIFDYFGKLTSLKDVTQVDCKRFDKKTATGVIVKALEKRNKQISLEAVETLLDYCNGYLSKAVMELDKIAYYDLNDPLINKKIVDTLVTKDEEFVVFELTEALATKNSNKALKVLKEMEKKQGILSLITNHFRRMFFVSTSSLDDKTLAGMFGVKEYAVSKIRSQSKNFSKIQLKKIFSLLEQIDFNIKSGAMLEQNALYKLCFSILFV